MGWLFAVALGMQERSRRGVLRALPPIALGHGLAIGQAVLPLEWIKVGVAAILVALGLYFLVGSRHPRWGGMQVGFRDLTIWSFLMASAHGAGFMVLPVVLGMSGGKHAAEFPGSQHAHLMSGYTGQWTNLLATLVHTVGYLAVTAVIAVLVYEKLGLGLLRKAWLNLDLIWAVALVATGCFVLLI
jgi:hypothetical protein